VRVSLSTSGIDPVQSRISLRSQDPDAQYAPLTDQAGLATELPVYNNGRVSADRSAAQSGVGIVRARYLVNESLLCGGFGTVVSATADQM
jgi:hypothetical protein